jgi:hypothetical protein
MLCGSNDARLKPGSPCLPGNHPYGVDCELIGALGEVCDDPTATKGVSWGAVKGLYQ